MTPVDRWSDAGSAARFASPAAELNSGLDVLDRGECLSLLRSKAVGRLGVVFNGRPEIFPVNYVVDDDGALMLRTGPGRKLSGALNQAVAFEVDDLDDAAGTAWSVVVHGTARPLSATAHFDLERRLGGAPIVPQGSEHRHRVLRLATSDMTGRRVVPPRRSGR